MKRVLFILFTALCCFSCNNPEELQMCSLYGVVTDKVTGEPVKSAGVELLPVGLKSVTGSDGTFEFANIEEGTYKLFITKAGYQNHTTSDIVVKASAEGQSHSIQIEKLPPSLSIMDSDGNELTTIDFGANPEVVMRSFFIFNKGEETLDWSIVYECLWISSISKQSGELKPNASQPLVLNIDRSKLNNGENATTIHVISNSGTRQIAVSATSESILETYDATNVLGNSAVLYGKIIRDMSPSITEYGFVYSKNSTPTIENGATKKTLSGRPTFGSTYNSNVTNLELGTTYYARAYAANQNGAVYGNTINFKTATTTDGLPVVSTINPGENVTETSISTGGNVTNDGGIQVTECGVVYNTTPSPTINNSLKIVGGSGTGSFSITITGVSPFTTMYYIRAYATNANGTAYGEQIIITPEYYNLRTMSYGGYTYKVKALGYMSWYDGKAACESLTLGGFSDWLMPNNEEVRAIIEKAYGYDMSGNRCWKSKPKIEGFEEIWGQEYDETNAYYFYIYAARTTTNDYVYWWIKSNSTCGKSVSKGAFAVRKCN